MNIDDFDAKVLNHSLALALEWGENWLIPIQKRVKVHYPALNSKQADFLNTTCNSVMKDINAFIYQILSQKQTSQNILFKKVTAYTNTLYPWINEENFSSLFNQGCYYACKDGLEVL